MTKIKAVSLKDTILQEFEKGNIVLLSGDGFLTCDLQDFIKQPTLGLLYDLNRDEATVLTFVDNPKWVNDFAVCKVIAALKKKADKYDTLEAKIAEFYERDQGDLADIGEVAARAFGFI